MDYQTLMAHVSAECEAADWQAAADKLNAYDIPYNITKSYTLGDLIELLGIDDARVIAGTMKAASADPIIDGAYQAMMSRGIMLYQPERQALIDGLATAGGWSDALKAKAKQAGISYQNRLGGTEASPITCTAEEVEAVYKKGKLEAWWETEQAKPDGIAVALQEGDSVKLKAALEAAAAQL